MQINMEKVSLINAVWDKDEALRIGFYDQYVDGRNTKVKVWIKGEILKYECYTFIVDLFRLKDGNFYVEVYDVKSDNEGVALMPDLKKGKLTKEEVYARVQQKPKFEL